MSTNQTIRKEVLPKICRRRKGLVEKSRTARTWLLILMVGFNTLGVALRSLDCLSSCQLVKKLVLLPQGEALKKYAFEEYFLVEKWRVKGKNSWWVTPYYFSQCGGPFHKLTCDTRRDQNRTEPKDMGPLSHTFPSGMTKNNNSDRIVSGRGPWLEIINILITVGPLWSISYQ